MDFNQVFEQYNIQYKRVLDDDYYKTTLKLAKMDNPTPEELLKVKVKIGKNFIRTHGEERIMKRSGFAKAMGFTEEEEKLLNLFVNCFCIDVCENEKMESVRLEYCVENEVLRGWLGFLNKNTPETFEEMFNDYKMIRSFCPDKTLSKLNEILSEKFNVMLGKINRSQMMKELSIKTDQLLTVGITEK